MRRQSSGQIQFISAFASYNSKPDRHHSHRINVGVLAYLIPQNYLEFPAQDNPGLAITYPGYQPFTEQTRACFEQKLPTNGPAPCRIIHFILHGSTGPGSGGHALTNQEMFDNFKKNSPGLGSAKPGRLVMICTCKGIIQTGSKIIGERDGNIFFNCLIRYEADRDHGSICNDYFALDDGNHVHAFLYPHQIGIVPEFEAAVRRIVKNFERRGRTP